MDTNVTARIDNAITNDHRRQLEHELSTTFIAQQKEHDPAERTRLWNRCLELVAELERMNKSDS